LLRITLTSDQKFRLWTSLSDISPALIDSTLRFEDKYYRQHPGVNPFALLRSAFNLRASGVHSGASTITMQLARLRYHLCTRTLDSAQGNWYDRAKINRQFSARLFSARAQTERKFLAPHFVQQVLATEKNRSEIVTTLDLAKQQLIERRITDYIQTNRGRGIQNAAAILVDTHTMEVLAQVGSADFFNSEIQGQV